MLRIMRSSALMDSTKTDNNPVERNVNMFYHTKTKSEVTTKADVTMDGSSVRASAGDLPPKSIQTENGNTGVYEGLSVTDIANHTAL